MIRDEGGAKDIVQETFSGMWLKADLVPVQENLPPYLYTTARNKVLNVFRYHK